ncbi:hypothetical protein B5V88_07115 [Heyndrickxia sporothermodurans]|uniref:Helix-turn-helix transcriptional regulator n=1 Tax=Heyndrickxia sporothermodurans TaxID=46224 RepID=A0AB37HPF4_9BACI|nr:helix-turn-helix transcriptional regulator [Heyndrickxia sporothermodurans]MBL5767357.1 helix-turn-helix transcriptional regulator [Heyndrickxia sporothermodurans]MBL5770830.1 helix-turn-helix transcriptional regulator [Heyndrickxia sporothermodurans]MBL5774470.1 helix-turn-helix transcriptional regulator [Heyndrickxia sporothermodurans]MBL5780153.1 helix-turn-helix transcriptional regulator [Heyndrickxia sporothermodurans]MBL5781557.1 helix-turn-helix transcriptional regulator [Heyndrickxi
MENKNRGLIIEQAVEDFGAAVREFRVRNSLSLQDLAEIAGVSASFIWRIENNRRNAELDTRVKIMILGMGWNNVDVHLYLDKYIEKTISDQL